MQNKCFSLHRPVPMNLSGSTKRANGMPLTLVNFDKSTVCAPSECRNCGFFIRKMVKTRAITRVWIRVNSISWWDLSFIMYWMVCDIVSRNSWLNDGHIGVAIQNGRCSAATVRYFIGFALRFYFCSFVRFSIRLPESVIFLHQTSGHYGMFRPFPK